MPMSQEQQYSILVQSLRLVAASPQDQRAAMPDFVSVTDEVATTFGDAFLLVPQLERVGRVGDRCTTYMRRLDAHLGAMPHEEVADPASLDDHPFWAEARRLAREALASLGEAVSLLDLRHLAWLPSRN